IITKNYDDLARNLLERGILNNLRAVEKPKDLQLGNGGAPQIARGPAVFKATPSPSGDRFMRKGSRQVQMDLRTTLKQKIHKRLIEVLDLKRLDQELKGKENKEELLRERT